MVRDIIFAYFLGASGLMDGWVVAFKIPNLARRLFGEGAASSSFIPVYSKQIVSDRKSADELACTVVTVVFVILAAAVLVGELFIFSYYTFFADLGPTRFKLVLAGIMLPYMILICVVAIIAGILNSHGHFAAPAFAPVVLNVFIIASMCFSGWVVAAGPTVQVIVTAFAVIIAGLVQLFSQFGPLKRHGVSLRPAWQVRTAGFRQVITLMGPMILGLTVTQINTLLDDFIALGLSGSAEKGEFLSFFGSSVQYPVWEGAVSHLFYAQRLYQLPLGVFGISLATAIFPVMSRNAAEGNMPELCRTISRGLKGAVFVALPSAAGLIIVRELLIRVIFQRGRFETADTVETAFTLVFYSAGIVGFFLQQILTRAFYASHDSKMPAITAVIAVCVNFVLNLLLIWPLGTAGLALSTAVSSYIQVSVMLVVLKKRMGGDIIGGAGLEVVKTVFCTFIMVSSGLFVKHALWALPKGIIYEISGLAAIVIISAGVYSLCARVVRAESLALIFSHKRKI